MVGENLRATLEWLPEGKRLLTIKCDCVLDITPTDLKLAPPDAERLNALYERFEFKSWLHDPSTAAGKSGGRSAGSHATTMARDAIEKAA